MRVNYSLIEQLKPTVVEYIQMKLQLSLLDEGLDLQTRLKIIQFNDKLLNPLNRFLGLGVLGYQVINCFLEKFSLVICLALDILKQILHYHFDLKFNLNL